MKNQTYSARGAKPEDLRSRRRVAASFNVGLQRDLSVSHIKLGDVLTAQGDLARALGAYRASLAVSERLAAADPSNAGWQRDVWVSYWRMATVAEQTGTDDPTEWWRKAYEQLFGMRRRGLFISAQDESFLEELRRKAGGGA